jgi:oxepin-CoA hydrolase/3-oxo-5,6-dehydrosuberyl-CoA semialdehyde dehydrogenase
VTPDDPEFDLFIKEWREMTAKAGQKCTAIRRAIVPRHLVDAVAGAGRACQDRGRRPGGGGVRMGALASKAQQADVAERWRCWQNCELLLASATASRRVARAWPTAPSSRPRCCWRDPASSDAHHLEAFGPVSTPDALWRLRRGAAPGRAGPRQPGGTVCTKTPALAAGGADRAAWHGRLLVLDREAAPESTGHGSPLPKLKHGGPGRAGGGEELGGLRAVKHYLQRCAVQGSPTMMAAVTGEYQRGGAVIETEVHPPPPLRGPEIGMSLLTHRRTVGEADIVAFGGLSGDYFYMHFDEVAAKASPFGQRIAHGYFVLSAAAGLFVSPAPGPVLANYGLENLRFVTPVAIGDTIQARLTAKRKIDRPPRDDHPAQGVIGWDVAVTNQRGELCASYEILTLVAKRAAG